MKLLLASTALFAAACTGEAPPPAPAAPQALQVRPTPPAFQAPLAGQRLVLQAEAKGDQIYTCSPAAAGAFEWKLKAPEAELFDATGKLIGKHYAGPTWASLDGSTVVGQVKEKMDAPDPDAIPWLVLEAKSNAGKGVLAGVTTVQRVGTRGGKAPKDGCDAGHAGLEARVGYRARYYFYAM